MKQGAPRPLTKERKRRVDLKAAWVALYTMIGALGGGGGVLGVQHADKIREAKMVQEFSQGVDMSLPDLEVKSEEHLIVADEPNFHGKSSMPDAVKPAAESDSHGLSKAPPLPTPEQRAERELFYKNLLAAIQREPELEELFAMMPPEDREPITNAFFKLMKARDLPVESIQAVHAVITDEKMIKEATKGLEDFVQRVYLSTLQGSNI